MSVLEITLLVLGLIAFFISFFIPDKQTGNEIDNYSQEELRSLIENELENMKGRLSDSADETINYSVEKAERSLERISNEKMIAFGEYSDTVMSQINKNHQEVVFLSDMLTKNKNDLTILLGQAVSDSKVALDCAKKAQETADNAAKEADKALSNARNAKEMVIFAEDKIISTRKAAKTNMEMSEDRLSDKLIKPDKPVEANNNMDSEANMVTEAAPLDNEAEKKTVKKTTRKKTKTEDTSLGKNDVDGQISLKFDNNEETNKNSNDLVLKLHKKGKSNVAIAKELGLGIGEVKLVIDLFENKKK